MTKKITPSKRFRVQFDFDYTPVKGKTMSDEIKTIPDMTLTVRQLIQNHTRGIDGVVKEQQPIYFDMEIPTIKDLTDVTEYREILQERLIQADQFIKDDLAKDKLEQEAQATKAENIEAQKKQQTMFTEEIIKKETPTDGRPTFENH